MNYTGQQYNKKIAKTRIALYIIHYMETNNEMAWYPF